MGVNFKGNTYYEMKSNKVGDINKNVEDFIIELLNFLDDKCRLTLLIMDNCPNNLTEKILLHINLLTYVKVLYGVPYYCELNMVEYVFCEIKNILKKKRILDIEYLKSSIKDVLDNDISKFIRICNGRWSKSIFKSFYKSKSRGKLLIDDCKDR